MKLIANYKHHFIDEYGDVYSNYSGSIRKIKTFYDKNNRYEYVVISENGNRKHHAIHRLVADAFLPNPNGFLEINHIDNNPHNNMANNLEWCNRKYNLMQSYKTMSPVRNYRNCTLYKSNIPIGQFAGIKPAAQYAAERFNVSYFSLAKYLHSQDISIVVQ